MGDNFKGPNGRGGLLELAPAVSRLQSSEPIPIPGHNAPLPLQSTGPVPSPRPPSLQSSDPVPIPGFIGPPNPMLMKQAALKDAPPQVPPPPPTQAQLDDIAAAKLEDIAANEKRRQKALLNDMGVPQIHHELIINDSWKPNAASEAVADFLADPKALLLVIAGPVGRGKSVAGALMVTQPSPDEYQQYTWEYIKGLDELAASDSVPWPPELHSRFITSADWSKLDQYNNDEIAPYRSCSMLVIDDLGTEFADRKEYFLRHLIVLINYRHSQGLRTLITSNFTMAEFKDFVGEKVEDRIRQCGKFVVIDGESYRGRKYMVGRTTGGE